MSFRYSQAPGTRGPTLELRFYRIKIFKTGKISSFAIVRLPLGKNRFQAPGYSKHKPMYVSIACIRKINIKSIYTKLPNLNSMSWW